MTFPGEVVLANASDHFLGNGKAIGLFPDRTRNLP